MAVVQIDNVSQTFGSGETAVQALKPASLAVEAGELAALQHKFARRPLSLEEAASVAG